MKSMIVDVDVDIFGVTVKYENGFKRQYCCCFDPFPYIDWEQLPATVKAWFYENPERLDEYEAACVEYEEKRRINQLYDRMCTTARNGGDMEPYRDILEIMPKDVVCGLAHHEMGMPYKGRDTKKGALAYIFSK